MRRLVLLAALAGCTTQDQWRAAGSTFTVGAYQGHISTDGAFRLGKDFDTRAENYGVFGSIQPFAYWGMKQQAEMNACAMTEAAYERRLAEMQAEPKPK